MNVLIFKEKHTLGHCMYKIFYMYIHVHVDLTDKHSTDFTVLFFGSTCT